MMPHFLEVVQQHILDVTGYCYVIFVANLTVFPAVKEFCKSVTI